MRRVVAAAVLLVAACGSTATNEDWVVAVTNGEPARVGRCSSMDQITEGVEMGGSHEQELGLYRVSDRADGDAVAECFERKGFDAVVREATQSDREAFDV